MAYGTSATYAYDGDNMRVQKNANGTPTVFIWSGSRDIAEYDNGAAPASPSREFVYADGLPGNGLVASITAGTPPTTIYFHSDHLSTRLITDVNGNDIGEQGHFPFGESWYTKNSANGEWVFTTYQRDQESGLDYALARYYDSTVARFCSADPLGGQPGDPQSWNRYVYARNDPINLIDPSGMGFLGWLLKGFGILVAAIGVLTSNPALVQVGLQLGGAGLWASLGGLNLPNPTQPTFPGGDPTLLTGLYNPPQLAPWVTNNWQGQGQGQGPPPPCAVPTWLQSIVIRGLQKIAKKTGRTIGVGAGGSGGGAVGVVRGVGGPGIGVAGSYSRQLLVNPNGDAAFQETWSSTIDPQTGNPLGVAAGIGGGFGPQVSWSSETNLQSFGGKGIDFNAGWAEGAGISGDFSIGDGGVIQKTITVAEGAGGWGGAALYSISTVTPVCPP